ncbi:MAG: ABC transporter permease [Alphaproteobacteria bacterium]|nr:ABC transporter permease [Alphaproteobacteria bacterium]
MEAQLSYLQNQQNLTVKLSGDFCGFTHNDSINQLFELLNTSKNLTFETQGLGEWDSTLVVILFQTGLFAKKHNITVDWDSLPDNLHELVRLALTPNVVPPVEEAETGSLPERVGSWAINIYDSVRKGIAFIGQAFASFFRLLSGTAVMRKVDFLFALEACSYKALGIVSIVSFMVGLILAYVGSIQLKNFGAQVYVASLVAIGMTRIMGAIMAGIVMSGRTGAAYAATIGTMQVNEEIDALKTMGISTTDFLVLPRLAALIITMPFLTLLADTMGILGGAVIGIFTLEIPYQEYWKYTYDALRQSTFWVGIFHGFVYGWIISLCGCYYGIFSGRNADSVGVATTKAVVSSIVWMIVITGILTFVFQELKL